MRAAVDEAAAQATARQRQLAISEDDDVLARLDPRETEVIELTPAEQATFISAVQPVVDKYRHRFAPDLFEDLGD